MIRLTKLNKFYNKGKTNQIHVINNTSITFPDTGLVALTGPSGCGKTTLLNVIGGLDKVESGVFDFDGLKLEGYSSTKWDSVRNQYIGYIFQNYNLVTDKTVYENIEMVLNMAGLYKKNEIEERINYVLRSVGMYNYRKRNVLALSGGQQQRVAIARAIAKNPKVILADEPTGNLDANNTFEIMSIIKKISENCLVILVSHEREIVNFYADRVIEIKDGTVEKDYENKGNRTIDHVDDRNIYLLDLNHDEVSGSANVHLYYQDELEDQPEITLVYQKNAVYVNVKSKNKVKFLNDDSEIRLVEEHYKKPETTDASEYDFNLDQFGVIKTESKKSYFRFKDTILSSLKKMFGKRKFFGKVFLFAYFAISAMVVINLATLGSITKIDETDFLSVSRDLVAVKITDDMTLDTIQGLVNQQNAIDKVMIYTTQVSVNFFYKDLYQGSINPQFVSQQVYPVPLSLIDETDLIEGSLPTSSNQVVIDEWVAKQLLKNKSLSDLGVVDYGSMIGTYVSTGYNTADVKIKVVGIVSTKSPIIVLTDESYTQFASSYVSTARAIGATDEVYPISSGRTLENDDEVLLNDQFVSLQTYQLGSSYPIGEHTYTVVGFYTSSSFGKALVTNETYENLVIERILSSQTVALYFHSTDVETSVEKLKALGFNASDSYQTARTEYVANLKSEIASRVQYILVTLAGIVVYIFLMMRSSVMNRIKEIGVYRAIGSTKRDIYKIFFSEILVTTTAGSLTGYLFMAFLVIRIQNSIGTVLSLFYLPAYLFFAGIVIIYLINIIFGMLPIVTLLRKTPAEIITKYDI